MQARAPIVLDDDLPALYCPNADVPSMEAAEAWDETWTGETAPPCSAFTAKISAFNTLKVLHNVPRIRMLCFSTTRKGSFHYKFVKRLLVQGETYWLYEQETVNDSFGEHVLLRLVQPPLVLTVKSQINAETHDTTIVLTTADGIDIWQSVVEAATMVRCFQFRNMLRSTMTERDICTVSTGLKLLTTDGEVYRGNAVIKPAYRSVACVRKRRLND